MLPVGGPGQRTRSLRRQGRRRSTRSARGSRPRRRRRRSRSWLRRSCACCVDVRRLALAGGGASGSRRQVRFPGWRASAISVWGMPPSRIAGLPDPAVGHLPGAAADLAPGAGCGEPGGGPFPDEVPFEAGEGAEDTEDDFAAGGGGGVAFLEVGDRLQQVRQVPTESVEPPHDEGVTVAQMREQAAEFGPGRRRAARGVGPDP